jgi:predicted ATPase with chaperone activity
MAEELGNRLIREKLVTEEQVEKALARQKLHGGRLGANLIALGFIEQETLHAFFKKSPPPPRSVLDTGLELELIVDLVLKTVSFMTTFTLQEVTERIRLPIPIVDRALEVLRREKLCEVKGGTDYARTSYRFTVTALGRERAQKPMAQSDYIGPAPVSLDDYQTMVESQSIKTAFVNQENIKRAFSHLVVNPQILNQLGPALNSGKSIFLYGPSGNGKTTIAETIASLFDDSIYIPYAIEVDRQIIRIYDPSAHQKISDESSASPSSVSEETDPSENSYDHRWVLCKRPIVMIGGELTLEMLDLEFDEISKFYEAPLQLKANGGSFIVDDFGRQILRPRELLNRWIVPLERRTDFLTLHTGKKFEVPFDELIIFSTNIDPKELVDEAFLRRIRYKIEIGHPTSEEYGAIFKSVCDQNGIEFKSDVLDFLFKECYQKVKTPLNACHPRDLIDQVIDITRYRETQPVLTKELIAEAWANYFVKL